MIPLRSLEDIPLGWNSLTGIDPKHMLVTTTVGSSFMATISPKNWINLFIVQILSFSSVFPCWRKMKGWGQGIIEQEGKCCNHLPLFIVTISHLLPTYTTVSWAYNWLLHSFIWERQFILFFLKVPYWMMMLLGPKNFFSSKFMLKCHCQC